jgi:hypothetical protein
LIARIARTVFDAWSTLDSTGSAEETPARNVPRTISGQVVPIGGDMQRN